MPKPNGLNDFRQPSPRRAQAYGPMGFCRFFAWRALLPGVVFLLASSLGLAEPTPEGLWQTVDPKTHRAKALVRITTTNDGLVGVIVKITDPSAPPNPLCAKCPGARTNQPLLGMQIIQGASRSATNTLVWNDGTIFDPERGREFKVKLTLDPDGNTLFVRGYVGIELLGETQVWIRQGP